MRHLLPQADQVLAMMDDSLQQLRRMPDYLTHKDYCNIFNHEVRCSAPAYFEAKQTANIKRDPAHGPAHIKGMERQLRPQTAHVTNEDAFDDLSTISHHAMESRHDGFTLVNRSYNKNP